MGCCSDSIVQLVQGDTRPTLQLFLYDATTGKAFDFSDIGDIVVFMLKPLAGNKPVKEVLTCQKLPGTVLDDGTVSYDPAWAVPGSGGRVEVHWTATALDTAGQFSGKAQIQWHDATEQTMVDDIRIDIQQAWEVVTP